MKIDSITQTIERALSAAGLRSDVGPLKDVTATIQKALRAAGLGRADGQSSSDAGQAADTPVLDAGEFVARKLQHRQASRAYKLYIPPGYVGQALPLIVMLHGCKQNPDDFAAGTRMNEIAAQRGFFVAYPAQTARENGANCWNWFERQQQQREGDEPSLIAAIVRDIANDHAVDAAKVFVAGLSAGAAMAVVLGATYPEVFAGVGAHSGLPLGAAQDVASAFAAMRGARAAAGSANTRIPAVPTIVIHGDADSTVALSNGDAIVKQAVQAHANESATLRRVVEGAGELNGRRCSITRYVDANDRSRVAEIVVHGGAHTWFGGAPAGSYTVTSGPDASALMAQFFLGARP